MGVTPGVVAVVVTHRRLPELERLLEGLGRSTLPLLGCVISDHSPTGEVTSLALKATVPTIVREDSTNPGPGAGWANGAEKALEHFGDAVDALWFLDDDVVVDAEALAVLWKEMTRARAEAIAPLLTDASGRLWAFPEPELYARREVIRQAETPADALRLLGDGPMPFSWCTGACFLVTRAAYKVAGGHRSDFWMLGEDLEYSMRVAAMARAVFTCKVTVPHLPPPAKDAASARRGDYMKFVSLLQNLSYLSFHSRYSGHMARYLPGNYRRFFKNHGFSWRSLRDAADCFWSGAIAGEPAGGERGQLLRQRIGRKP